MKIVHVTASLSRLAAGVSQTVWNFGREVRALGHDVSIVGVRDEFTDRDVGPDPGCPYRACRCSFPQSFSRSPDMALVLAEAAAGADVIHSHGLWLYPGMVARRFAESRRIPRIVSVHGMLEPWAFRHRAWKKRLAWHLFERESLRRAACLHAASEKEAANFRALGLHNPIAVVPLGIHPAPYQSPPETPRVRQLRKATGGKRLLLYLSRLHAVKGPDLLLDAWSRLAAQFPEWHLVLAGPDAEGYRAVLEAQTRQSGLEGRVTFSGPVYEADKYALLAAAELFVLPTHSENFGLVVAEALAAGVPVITTKGTPWEELQTHQCGWWVDQGVDTLATTLEEAMSMPARTLRDMGLQGRGLAETKYAWPTLAARMLSVYEWIRSGGAPPACVIVGT